MSGIFYKSDQKLAEKLGCPDMFDSVDFEANSNERTHKLCKWIKENDKNPSPGSKNIEVQQLGKFLSLRKSARVGKFHCIFYKSDQKIAESYGLNDLFKITRGPRKEAYERIHTLCKWIKENDKNPLGNSKNIEEKQLGIFLSNKKMAKGGKGGNFYKSDQKIAESYGLKELFGKEKVSMSESKNRIDKAMISLSGTDYKSWADECKLGITDEQHSLKQTKLCDEFKTKHGHYPIASSKDDYERKLSEWLQSKKSAKKNGEHK